MSTALTPVERHEAALSPLFNELNTVENSVAAIIELLPNLEEDRLLDIADYANRLGKGAWILRGAATLEIRKRSETRQAGGRGKKDEEGVGVKAQIAALAARIGVQPRTIEADAQIVERFFSAPGDVQKAIDDTLDRGHYIQALRAPLPEEAIKLAQDKAQAGNYTPKQMAADVDALRTSAENQAIAEATIVVDKGGKQSKSEQAKAQRAATEAQEKIKNTWVLEARISVPHKKRLSAIGKQAKLPVSQLIEKMIDMASTTFDTAEAKVVPIRNATIERLQAALTSLGRKFSEDAAVSDLVDEIIALAASAKPPVDGVIIPGKSAAELEANADFQRIAPNVTLAEICKLCPEASETTVRKAWRSVSRSAKAVFDGEGQNSPTEASEAADTSTEGEVAEEVTDSPTEASEADTEATTADVEEFDINDGDSTE